MAEALVLSIDQGTTSVSALAFDREGKIRGLAQREFRQIFPDDGWVEHDANEIWQTTLDVCRTVWMGRAGKIHGIGITNQRKRSHMGQKNGADCQCDCLARPAHGGLCAKIAAAGHEDMVREKTGLLLDPYFSASKMAWLSTMCRRARGRRPVNWLSAR